MRFAARKDSIIVKASDGKNFTQVEILTLLGASSLVVFESLGEGGRRCEKCTATQTALFKKDPANFFLTKTDFFAIFSLLI